MPTPALAIRARDYAPVPGEPTGLRDEIWRVQDQLNKRIDALSEHTDTRMDKLEAAHAQRHADNVARLNKLETTFLQGMGAAAALRWVWHAMTAVISVALGYVMHYLTNR